MSNSVINIPSEGIQDTIENNNSSSTEQVNADIRHDELMCQLKEMNSNLKILTTYFAFLMGHRITKEDVE